MTQVGPGQTPVRLPGGKRPGRPGHNLESLLQVAARLFYERGYDCTSMEELSHKLRITKSAIYHHVSSKEELLRLAVNRALDGLFAIAAEAEQTPGPSIDQLEHLVRGSVLVLSEQLPFVTLLLRVRGNTKVERQALARRREFDHIVANLVQQAKNEGDIRSDVDTVITARLLFGMVNSLIEWYKLRHESCGATLADAVAKIAFSGIRAHS